MTSACNTVLERNYCDVITRKYTYIHQIYSKGIFTDSLGLDVIRRDRKGDVHGGVIIAA